MSISAYFEEIDRHIFQSLRSAKNSVKICVAWISQSYIDAIQEIANTGIVVDVIYNSDHINLRSQWNPTPNLTLYPLKSQFGNSLMHNKFCIIDDEIIITGSFNWSRAAVRHFENIVISRNECQLVESFLHEFEDLRNYALRPLSWGGIQCQESYFGGISSCRSKSFNIGIIGNASGIYQESKIDVWNVCFKHYHATHITEWYDQYIIAQLGLSAEIDIEDEPPIDAHGVRERFRREREKINTLQKYFQSNSQILVHAIGAVCVQDEIWHIKYGTPIEHEVQILWRDMYYRKLIPSVLHDFGEINKIINSHAT